MGQNRTFRLLSEIHEEVRVKGQTARIGVHIQQDQEGALPETETSFVNSVLSTELREDSSV
jgi:hypothetical protein